MSDDLCCEGGQSKFGNWVAVMLVLFLLVYLGHSVAVKTTISPSRLHSQAAAHEAKRAEILSSTAANRLERVTLVIVNRLSLEDLRAQTGGSLERLAHIGGIGLMNTRTGGGLTPENAYTTIGGGFRVVGAAGAKLALPAREEYHDQKAGDIYRRRTGWEAVSDSIVVLDIESIKANNLASVGTEQVGVIGEALRQAGKGVALIGDADSDEYQRWAALIAMDGRGQVPVGKVGAGMNHLDPLFPTGRRSNLEALWHAYLGVRPIAQFVVVDLGDMDRVEAERKQLRVSQYQYYRREALGGIEWFLDQLLEEVDLDREWVMVASPIPTGEDIAGGRLLTPMMIAGPGIMPGFLISRTTRRCGVVTNYDIAPSVLSWLGLRWPKGLPGAVITSTMQPAVIGFERKGSSDGGETDITLARSNQLELEFDYLQELLTRSAATYKQRPPLLRAFVSLEIVIYLTAFGFLIAFPSLPRKWTAFISFALLLVASMPLALLILPVLRPATVLFAFFYTLAIALLFTGTTWYLAPSMESKYAVVCGLTAVSLVLDICLGSPLIKFSPLGYDVMLGARFYGIGNEYMGILIGSSLLTALVVREYWPRVTAIVLLWFLAVIVLLASPNLGANAGGTITALTAFPLAYGLWSHVGRKTTMLVVVVIIIGVLWINLVPLAGTGSHVTRALRVVTQGDWSEIGRILQRKLSMNLKLMRYSIWSKGLLVALGVMAILVYRPTPAVQIAMGEHPPVRGIVFSTITASLVALIFNDSGVVAGGTTSVYAAGLVLSLILEQRAQG